MADKRREFFDRIMREEPGISDQDLSVLLKKFDTDNPPEAESSFAMKAGTGVVKGVGDVTGVTPIVNAAQVAPGALSDIVDNAVSGAQSLKKSGGEFVRGALSSPMGRMMNTFINPSMAANPEMGANIQSLKDVQGAVDPAAGDVDPVEANARRITNVLGMVYGGKLLGKAGGAKGPAPKLPGAIEGDLAGMTTRSATGTQLPNVPEAVAPVKTVKGGAVTGPNITTMAEVKPKLPVPTNTAAIDTPPPSAGVKSVLGGSVTGPRISMSVPVKPKPPVVKTSPPVKAPVVTPIEAPPVAATPPLKATPPIIEGPPPTTQAEANAKAKVEAAMEAQLAGRTQPPGTEPSYKGAERRGSERVNSPEMDRLMNETRIRMTEKLPQPSASPAPTGTRIAPEAMFEAVGGEHGGPKGPGTVTRIGYDKPSTSAPGATVPEAGPAATPSPANVLKGAGKPSVSPEVQARLDAGETREAIATDLRDKLGSKRAAKVMGATPDEVVKLSGGGPSKIPSNAVDTIKNTLGPKVENGTATPTEKALYDRVRSERGAADIKHLLIAAGGVAGGVLGYGTYKGKDPTSDQALGRTALGILAGASLPAAIMHPHVIPHALGLRTEGFLSGMAIPKNILNNTAAPIVASVENAGLTKGRMAPIKELFNVPKNTQEFLKAMKNPPTSNKYGKVAGPFSRTIGAIDTTARNMLERGGVPDAEINRLLLTENRQLFQGWKLSPRMQAVANVVYPFQRVPTNVAAQTLDGLGRMTGIDLDARGNVKFGKSGLISGNEKMKAALDIGATGGGVALGKWAKGDKKKMYLASIAMAILGPRAGLGTLGAMTQVGRQGMGGISPIPEQNADLASFVGWPPTGWKALKKITGQE